MTLHEIVVCKVQGYGCLEIIQLLAESQRKTREPLHMKPSSRVQAINVASRNQIHVGIAHDGPTDGRSESQSTVFALGMLCGVVSVYLHDLAVIHFRPERFLDRLHIAMQGIGRNLNLIPHSTGNVFDELRCDGSCTLPASERRDQLW